MVEALCLVNRIEHFVEIVEVTDERQVPEKEDKPRPTPEQIQENKRKWGYTG